MCMATGMLFCWSAFSRHVGFDEDLFRAINSGWASPPLEQKVTEAIRAALDPVMVAVSLLGSYLMVVYVIPIWISHRKERAFDVLVALGIAVVLTTALKLAIGRPRPPDVLGGAVRMVSVPFSSESDPAFPSGHVSRVAALAAVLSFHERKFSIPLGLFVFLEALSRVYVGAHWPTDTIGGAVVGIIVGLAVWHLNRTGGYMRLRAAVLRPLGVTSDRAGRS